MGQELRTPRSPEAVCGVGIQPERLAAVLRHTPRGARILDLGSGRGAYTGELTRLGFLTVGVDKRLYREWRGKTDGDFINASGFALPFEDKTFDTAIAFEVLEHCPDPRSVLREVVRCTSARVILSVPNCDLDNALRRYDLAMAHWTDTTHCYYFTKDGIRNLVAGVGLAVTEMSDCYCISPNNYFWDTIRIPRAIANIVRSLCDRFRLTETYWSSILVAADIPSPTSNTVSFTQDHEQ